MTKVDNLDEALASMDAQIEGRYVFVSVDTAVPGIEPFATIREPQGLTLIIRAEDAESLGLASEGVFVRITSRAHTSLQAVGITSTITSTIASRGIPCNVVAGYYHDHFFVPADRADEALGVMRSLATQAEGWLPLADS